MKEPTKTERIQEPAAKVPPKETEAEVAQELPKAEPTDAELHLKAKKTAEAPADAFSDPVELQRQITQLVHSLKIQGEDYQKMSQNMVQMQAQMERKNHLISAYQNQLHRKSVELAELEASIIAAQTQHQKG